MLEVLFVTVPLIVYGVLDNNNKPSKRLGMTTTTTRRTSWASLNHEKVSVPVWNPQDSVCSIAMATRRRTSTVNRASIEEILKSGDNTQPAAPPSPHFTTSSKRMSTTSTTSTTSGAMEPPQSTQPLSFTPRTRPNRLSLQFPVSTSTTTESARPTPTSSNAPSVPATPNMAAMPSPNDPTAFLEALAGQERKVLELKEELEKAEKDLDILKKKWAYHEATKKRQEVRHVEQLQPLQTVATGSGDCKSEEKTLRRSLEQDRRRSMLANIQVESRRRVFSGSHTRTLSLLSPERSTHGQAQPFPSVRETSTDSRNSEHSLPRSTTMPDTSQGISRISSQRGNRHSFQGPSTDGVKQIAQDVKAGLWTFLEDLRQATVGDEAVNGTSHHSTDGSSLHGHNHNRRGSKGSLLTSGRGRNSHSKSPVRTWDNVVGASPEHGHDLLGHDWPEKSADGQAKKPSLKKKRSKSMIALTTPSVIDSLDDDWENWDSPTPNSPRWSGSTLQDPLTPSNHSTMKSIETDTPPKQSGEIPWPDLQNLKQNLTPSHLHRTVSTIMKEWEKSLTPPPEARQDPLNSKTESQSQPQSNSTVFSNIDACLM